MQSYAYAPGLYFIFAYKLNLRDLNERVKYHHNIMYSKIAQRKLSRLICRHFIPVNKNKTKYILAQVNLCYTKYK